MSHANQLRPAEGAPGRPPADPGSSPVRPRAVLAASGLGSVLVVAGVWGVRRLAVRRFGAPAQRRGTTPPTDGDVMAVMVPGPAGSTLRGLVLRAQECAGTAIVVHGWGGSALDLLPIGRVLQDEGLDVVLLDARGHGRSDSVELTSMPHFADDVRAAVRWWRGTDLSRSSLLLVGHSVGAGACLLAARDEPDVSGVVLLACMAQPQQVMRRLLADANVPRWLALPALRMVEHLIGHRFASFAPLHVVSGLEVPVLIVHGERDTTISVTDARALAAVARDAELVLVPGAGHSDLDAVPQVRTALRRLLDRIGPTSGQP